MLPQFRYLINRLALSSRPFAAGCSAVSRSYPNFPSRFSLSPPLGIGFVSCRNKASIAKPAKKAPKKTTSKSTTVSAKKAKSKKAVPAKVKAKAATRTGKSTEKRSKKEKAEEAKFKEKVKKAKERALKPPSKNPVSAYNMFTLEALKNTSGGINREASEQWKVLSTADRQRFAEKAAEYSKNKKDAYVRWVEGYTPAQILDANNARAWLRRHNLGKKSMVPIVDHRAPKRPRPAYFAWVAEQWSANPLKPGEQIIHRAPILSEQWKNMSENEKKPYKEVEVAERAKYAAEKKVVYAKT